MVRLHFDNTSIKILVGIIVGVLIFGTLVSLHNDEIAHIGEVDEDYTENPTAGTNPEDLRVDEDSGWFDTFKDVVLGPIMQFFGWIWDGLVWVWDIGGQAFGAIRQLNNNIEGFPLGDILILCLSIPLAIVIVRILGILS